MIKKVISAIYPEAFPDITSKIEKAVAEAKAGWDASLPQKPDWRQNMSFVFNLDGHDFYRFDSAAEMPLNRLERMQELLIMLDNRLTRAELGHLLDIAKGSYTEILNTLKTTGRIQAAERAVWAIEEITSRNDTLMFHPEILMELAAVTIICGDEDPTLINEDVQAYKKDLFRQGGGDVAFFMKLGVNTLIPSVQVSPDNWKKLWEAVERQTKYSAETYQKIAGKIKSTATEKS